VESHLSGSERKALRSDKVQLERTRGLGQVRFRKAMTSESLRNSGESGDWNIAVFGDAAQIDVELIQQAEELSANRAGRPGRRR
jgi:hypothetical protein